MATCIGQCLVVSALLASLPLALAANDPLQGTKRGPTGWYLTKAQRQELGERVKNEPCARKFYEERILPGVVGLAYVITGQGAYAEAAREKLMHAVKHWDGRPADFNTEKPAYRSRWGGNCAWGVSSALAGRVNMPVLYDLVAETLSDEQDATIRKTIKEIVDYSCNWMRLHGGNPNMNFIAFTSFYEWAASIGYEKTMDWLLNHRKPDTNHGGVLEMLDDYMRDKEISNEAPIYHTISLRVIDLAACAHRYDGRDLFRYKSPKGNTLKAMLDGLINTAYPIEETGIYKGTVRPANWGHGGTTYLGDIALINRPSGAWTIYSAEGAVASLLRVYPQDENYRYLMSLTGRATKKGTDELVGRPAMKDFLYGRLPITDDEPAPPAPSHIYRNAGVAMLRFPETGGYWRNGIAAWFHGGEPSRGHLGDPSLMLHGAGRLLFPQFLTTQYEDQMTTGWDMRRISRNTITVDGKDGAPFTSTWRHAFAPEVKFVSIRGRPYKQAELERVGMLTGEYLLDVFNARVAGKSEGLIDTYATEYYNYMYDTNLEVDVSNNPLRRKYTGMPESHTFDYTLHGLGRQFPDAWHLYEPSSEFTLSAWPNRWFMNEHKRQTDDDFHVDWVQTSANYAPDLDRAEHRGWDKVGEVWFQDRAGVRTRMLSDKGTTVYLAEGPMRWGPVDRDLTPEEIIPVLAVRRTGKEALFVAVHEPYEDKPAIKDIRYLHKPGKGETHPSVGVMVRGPDYVDRLYVTLGLDGTNSTWIGELVAKQKEKKKKLLSGKEEILNLTKGWLFKTDPDEVGEKQRWFHPGHDRKDWIKANAGINWQVFATGYYGTAWYGKSIEPLKLPEGKKLYMLFEGVDEDCWVFLDGKKIFERVAQPMGQFWDKPFTLDLTGVLMAGKSHELVVKVRKMAYQTGIYGEVRLMTDASPEAAVQPEKSKERTVEEREQPAPVPLSVVSSDNDPGEGIAYRGHAYIRIRGSQMVARGDIEALSIYAPGVQTVVLNGKETAFTRKGDYIIYGKGSWKPSRRPKPAAQRPRPWVPPLKASLPQRYVNISADKGGVLIVRVDNVVGTNVPGGAATGRIEIVADEPLKVEPAAIKVPSLAPGERRHFEVALSGGTFGKTLPLTVRLYVEKDGRERLAHQVRTDVSVGVTIEAIVQEYNRPMYKDYGGGQLSDYVSDQNENFNRFRVRAPGYTIEVDKFSGTSRSMIDPEGKQRIGAAGYPLRFTRGYASFEHDVRGTQRYPYEVPCVRGPDPARKTLGWWAEAKLLEQGNDPGTGYPTIRFQTQDGRYELDYLFRPDAVQVSFIPVEEGARPLRMEFKGLCVDHPTYRYRAHFKTDEFGFREGPYAKPRYGFDKLGGRNPYYSFRTCPKPAKDTK